MSRPEEFDTSDADADLVEPDAFDSSYDADGDWDDELRRRDEELYQSILDPLPDEDDESEEE